MTTDATRLDRIRHDIELVRKRGRASVDVEDAAWLLTALEAAQAHLDLAEARASEGDLACDQCDWSGPVSDCKQSAGDSVGRCDCPACGGDAESADWWRYELRRREDGWEDERWEMRKERDDLARRLAESEAGAAVMREALAGLLDAYKDDPCYHDHHGYCQAHFISSPCPVAEAQKAISSTTAGRDLLEEVKGLREMRRLADAYKAAVADRRQHRAAKPGADHPELSDWEAWDEQMTDSKRKAGEALFAALDALAKGGKE